MPNPFSLGNIGNFSYKGPGAGPPTPPGLAVPRQPMVPFKDGLRPADTDPAMALEQLRSSLPTLPPKPHLPIGLPAQLPTPDMVEERLDPGPQMFTSGYDAGAKIPGSISFKDGQVPNLGNEAALAGLAANQSSVTDPRFASLRLASQIRQQGLGMGQGFGAPSLGMANNIEEKAYGSFPQQNPAIQASLDAQHPAVSGLAERSALQKAYPQQAEAYGRIKSADIAAGADENVAILNNQQRELESEQKANPAAIAAIVELIKTGAIEGLPPDLRKQVDDYIRMNVGILQRPRDRGGL